MLVFLDTEFTDFVLPDLISIGLVAEDGREFCAEQTDYRPAECTILCVPPCCPYWAVCMVLPAAVQH